MPSPEDKEGLRTGNKQRASSMSWKVPNTGPPKPERDPKMRAAVTLCPHCHRNQQRLSRETSRRSIFHVTGPLLPPSPAPNLSALAQHRTSSRKPKAPLRPPQVRWDSRAEQVEEASDKVLAVRMQSLSAPSAPGWK